MNAMLPLGPGSHTHTYSLASTFFHSFTVVAYFFPIELLIVKEERKYYWKKSLKKKHSLTLNFKVFQKIKLTNPPKNSTSKRISMTKWSNIKGKELEFIKLDLTLLQTYFLPSKITKFTLCSFRSPHQMVAKSLHTIIYDSRKFSFTIHVGGCEKAKKCLLNLAAVATSACISHVSPWFLVTASWTTSFIVFWYCSLLVCVCVCVYQNYSDNALMYISWLCHSHDIIVNANVSFPCSLFSWMENFVMFMCKVRVKVENNIFKKYIFGKMFEWKNFLKKNC